MLSEKAMKILGALYQNAPNRLTAKRIAVITEMSERTVATYLKEVIAFCKENEICAQSKQGVGTSLMVTADDRTVIEEILYVEQTEDSHRYRVDYIIWILLNDSMAYTIGLLAEDLCVSRSTVQSCLEEAEEWLEYYGITVARKPGAGLSIAGDEHTIRKTIIIFNRSRVIFNYEVERREDIDDYRLEEKEYVRLYRNYKIRKIAPFIEAIHLTEDFLGCEWTEESFLLLLEYLIVQVKRSQNGCQLHSGETGISNVDIPKMEAARMMAAYLKKHGYGLDTPAEISYLFHLLTAAHWHERFSANAAVREMEINQSAAEIVHYVGRIFGADLRQDSILMEKLRTFLFPAMIRARLGFEIQNPLCAQIKENYPAVFSVCYAAGRFLGAGTNHYPSEEDISYLSLLIGGAMIRLQKKIKTVLVTAQEEDIARLTARTIMEKVSNIDIVQVIPYNERWRIKKEAPRLVLSTVMSYQEEGTASLYVSPRVKERDIRNMKKICNKLYMNVTPAEDEVTFENLISTDMIYIDLPLQTKEQAIRFAANVLEKEGCVNKSFYEKAIARERAASTALGHGIAVPHSTSAHVKKPAVCIIRLENEINWENERVNLIFVLALDFKEIKSTSAFFKRFYSITSNEEILDRIRSAGRKEEIIQILVESGEMQ